MATVQVDDQGKVASENESGATGADGAGEGSETLAAEQAGLMSGFAQTVEDTVKALRRGITGEGAGDQAAANHDRIARVLYRSSYMASYGVVFPVMLAVRLIPKDNPISHGLVDGGRAAIETVAKRRSTSESLEAAPEAGPTPAPQPA
jgi:hypothetical protein